MWRQVVVYIKNKSQMRADNIHLNNQHVLKTTENTEVHREQAAQCAIGMMMCKGRACAYLDAR